MTNQRRKIPADLLPRFVHLTEGLQRDMGDLDENTAWEVTARLLHAEVACEWDEFKKRLEIYGAEDVTGGQVWYDGGFDPYSGEWGGAL